jgi:GR25 family glycosyltransferase involved in LPS biosynthesis
MYASTHGAVYLSKIVMMLFLVGVAITYLVDRILYRDCTYPYNENSTATTHNTTVPQVVINLDRSTERLSHITKEFSRHGAIPIFHRLTTDCRNKLSVENAVAEMRYNHPEQALTACFHSHVRALRSFPEKAPLVAVFEDDIIVNRRLPSSLEQWNTFTKDPIPGDADIVALNGSTWGNAKQGKSKAAFQRSRGGWSCGALLWTRIGRRKFLAHVTENPQSIPIDNVMDGMIKDGTLNFYIMQNPPCECPNPFPTTLDNVYFKVKK